MKRIPAVYLLLVGVPAVGAVGLLGVISAAGPEGGGAVGVAENSVLRQLLVALTVVVGVSAVGGMVAEKLGQARVFGELVAGLLLGPTALGAVAPGVQQWLFPKNILPHLDSMAQLGVVFFMFLVGMEVSHAHLREVGARSAVIGHAAIAVPFLGGVAAAWWLYHSYPPAHPGILPFALFAGLSFAITAFPVLARILDEQNLLPTRLGNVGISAAGFCDITAWCLLAVVVTIVHHSALLPTLGAIGIAAGFTAVMLIVVRPLLERVVARAERAATPPIALYAGLVCVVLGSALVTEAIGVHAIFGAFLAGVVMPRGPVLVTELGTKLEGLTLWVLLPLFFVSVGLRTDIGSIATVAGVATCAAIIVIATTTKFLGTGAAALLVGETRRDALALAVMMNCRGLTELVVLNLGKQLGLLSDKLFAMFVIMAVVTTGITAPVLRRVTRKVHADQRIPHEAESAH
ncbi:cation:proton antiporter domain-containing protein [Nocardia sp. NPDC003482]